MSPPARRRRGERRPPPHRSSTRGAIRTHTADRRSWRRAVWAGRSGRRRCGSRPAGMAPRTAPRTSSTAAGCGSIARGRRPGCRPPARPRRTGRPRPPGPQPEGAPGTVHLGRSLGRPAGWHRQPRQLLREGVGRPGRCCRGCRLPGWARCPPGPHSPPGSRDWPPACLPDHLTLRETTKSALRSSR